MCIGGAPCYSGGQEKPKQQSLQATKQPVRRSGKYHSHTARPTKAFVRRPISCQGLIHLSRRQCLNPYLECQGLHRANEGSGNEAKQRTPHTPLCSGTSRPVARTCAGQLPSTQQMRSQGHHPRWFSVIEVSVVQTPQLKFILEKSPCGSSVTGEEESKHAHSSAPLPCAHSSPGKPSLGWRPKPV